MAINAGASSRTKRTAFMETGDGNVVFDANSTSHYSHIIAVDDEPIIVRGHHMGVGDEVLVEMVDGVGGGDHFSPYLRKGRQVRLTHKCNVLVLSIPGRYRFELMGDGLGIVFVNTYKASLTHEFLQEALDADCCSTCDEEVWVDSGVFRCVGDIVEKLQENQIGRKRWIESEPVKWVDTGNIRCTDMIVEQQQVNQCGDLRWVEKEPIQWSATGEERCKENELEIQQSNQCGQLRWFKTGQLCGWDASYPLPGKGFMFQEGDVKDPDATVEMTTCDGVLMGWLYPKPKPGATTVVRACDGTVLGYAVNRSETAASCHANCEVQGVQVKVSPQTNVVINSNS